MVCRVSPLSRVFCFNDEPRHTMASKPTCRPTQHRTRVRGIPKVRSAVRRRTRVYSSLFIKNDRRKENNKIISAKFHGFMSAYRIEPVRVLETAGLVFLVQAGFLAVNAQLVTLLKIRASFSLGNFRHFLRRWQQNFQCQKNY